MSLEPTTLDYAPAGVPVRDDLRDTHAAMLEYLRTPGPWLSGSERIAVAEESRNGPECPLCLERAAALSPEQARGQHARVTALPDPLVDIAHRVRTDSGGLSKAWFERTLASGLDEGAYVEAVGIVAFTAGLDHFCRALGIPPFPLPEPLPGAATGRRPAGARGGRAWVAMIAPEDATGPEADLYSGSFVPHIAQALSLVPDHSRVLQRESASHYVAMSDLTDPKVGRDLDRMQMELVAARVSALNECFY
jgi:alkylhydroperoxidase family enzyme